MNTILCVDDDGGVLATIKDMLDSQGYDVLITTNSAIASTCMKFQSVDLVILDIRMPQKDGFELYEEIQALKPVPVLFVSGCPQLFEDRIEQLRAQNPEKYNLERFDVLAKPFQLNVLLQKIKVMLSSAKEETTP